MNEKRSALGQIVSLWLALLKQAGAWKLILATGLALLGVVSEGFAILILIPALQSIDAASPAPVARGWLPPLLQDLGVRLHLFSALSLFLCLATARAVLNSQSDFYLNALRLNFLREMRIGLYSAIAHANWSFLRQRRPSDLLSALTAETDRLETAIYFVLQMPARAVRLATYVAAACLVAPVVASMALGIGFFLAWLVNSRLTESLRLGNRLSKAYENYHHNVCEFLAGLKLTKSYVAEDQHVCAFANAVDEVRDNQLARIKNQAGSRLVQEIAGAFTVAVFLAVSAGPFHMPSAQVLVLALILLRLLPLVQGLQEAAQQLLHMAPAAQSIYALSQACAAARETPHGRQPALHLKREIRVDNVTFRHKENDPDVFTNLSLRFPAGTLTVLAGPSGAGKSTLLDLLAGLLKPDKGKIWIDDCELTAIRTQAWRGSVAYVLQEPFLFNDTIRANLLVGNEEASEVELNEALRISHCYAFVDALPNRIDTVVGDRGTRFSGGERQRLALARALLRKPALLILDEPTSSLDSPNEQMVLEGIEALKGRVTMILVTHRPERVMAADQVFRLEGGVFQTCDISATTPP